MNRRGFLTGIFAFGAAPAIVKADSLMKLVPRQTEVLGFATVEYHWKTVAGSVVVPVEFSELMAETFRKHRIAIADAVAQRNAALKMCQWRPVADGYEIVCE